MPWCPQGEKQFAAEPGKIHENKLRHMFEGSWACFSAKKFARRREFEFEEASTRRPQLLIFDWK